MATPVIQFKRGSAGIAGTIPALRPGEPAFSTNNFDFFIGFDTSVTGNKFFGSHRYWDREDGTTSLGLNMVDKGGIKHIQIKSPNTITGAGYTLTLPPTQGTQSTVLTNDGNGNLSWDSGSFNAEFTGITTFVSGGFLDVNVPADFSGITTFSNIDVNGGYIDGTPIGTASSSRGVFTNLTAGVTTVTSLKINGSGTYTDIDTDLSTVSGGHDTLVSAKAVKDYVDAKVGFSSLTFDGDFGGEFTIDLDSETFTIAGSPNEITTTGAGNSITVGLVNDVQITTSLVVGSATTINSSGIDVGVGSVSAQELYGTLKASDLDIITGGLTTSTSLVSGDIFVVFDADDTENKTVSSEVIGQFVYSNITGDVQISAGGTATIQANSVGLGTDTFGQYAKTITGGSGLSATAANADDSTEYTISVNVGTGITITSDAVTLKGAASLTNNYLPAWDAVNGQLINSGAQYTVGGGTTITGDLHIIGTANIGTVSGTASTSQTVNTTGTTSSGTYYMLFADDSTSQTGETVRVSAAATLNPNGTGTFSVGTIQAGSIKSSIGSSSITISNSGTVAFATDVTINGNLYVEGTTTQVNTSEITVEDRTIELGVVDGNLPTDTTWDLGILMNYGESGVGKTSALIWETSGATPRFKLASNIGESVGINTNSPQITVSTYAPLEISELWINNGCTGGDVQVIGCVNSELQLQNITIDGGTFT
jgi:hypothetical protein